MFYLEITKMESQMVTSNQLRPASQFGGRLAILLPALFRLALLIGPVVLAIIALGRHPFPCILVCAGILSVWLTANVGPFRANGPASTPSADIKAVFPHARNLARARSWSSLFCGIVVIVALLRSKLSV